MRKITRLYKRNQPAPIGEWNVFVSDEDVYEQFAMRSTQTLGLAIDKLTFEEQYEIARFEEVGKLKPEELNWPDDHPSEKIVN